MPKDNKKGRHRSKSKNKGHPEVKFRNGKFTYKGKNKNIQYYVQCVNSYYPKGWTYVHTRRWLNSSATVITGDEGRILAKIIQAPYPTSPLNVCTILHEISHIMNGDCSDAVINRQLKGKAITKRERFIKELKASERAIGIMREHNITLSKTMKKNMIFALFEYLEDYYSEDLCK